VEFNVFVLFLHVKWRKLWLMWLSGINGVKCHKCGEGNPHEEERSRIVKSGIYCICYVFACKMKEIMTDATKR